MRSTTKRVHGHRATVLIVVTAICGASAQPAPAPPTAAEQAQALMQAWVDGPSLRRGETAKGSSLPDGTVLDRVVVKDTVGAAYVRIPAAFLESMTEIDCEKIICDQVGLLRQVEGLRGFALYAKPIGHAQADYKPLPDFLPPPEGERDKPEFELGEPVPGLRARGLPAYNPGKPVGALSGKTVFLSPGHGWYYSDTLGRWATQRGNWGGLIEDLSNGEAVFNHLARYLHNAGANVWPCRERDFNTNMVFLDNEDGSPSFTVTGTWPTSTAAGTWQGSNYQHHQVTTSETAVATYAPSIPEAGSYSVYIWTPSASNRSTDAKVRVNHTGGTTTHIINMQRDGNTWRFLGIYHFDAGRDAAKGSVEISNQGSDPSKYVIADAVRFGGGMGDYSEGGSVSGWPRWEESGRYFPVFMGQPGTPYGTVSAMPRYAKWESESWEDSIYFSWHTNATGAHTGHGTQMYVYGPNGPPSPFGEFSGVAGGDSLATRIFDEVINDIHADWDAGWPGGKYSAWFGELNPTYNDEMPACLIEVAYHDSATDQPSLLDPRFRDLVARACYQGIVDWWYNDADGPSTTPISIDTLLPESPTHLSVRNLGDGDVRVSWHAPPYNSGDDLLGDAATGYIVQMSEDGYGFDDGTTTTSLSMDVAGLDPGSIYYFRVIATNAGGQSFPSEIGGVMVRDNGVSPVLVVNGFDRLNRTMMLSEDDPYDSDPMLRERLERMNNYAYVRTFGAALDSAGIGFDFGANEAVRDGDVNLSTYQAVIWQSGEESSGDDTFDATEQSRVTTYLNGGGKLFVSGAEIGWDLDYLNNGRLFYNNYLKADYSADDADTYNVTSVPGSIFDGIAAFAFDNGLTIYDVDYPDVLNTCGSSTAALSYSGGTGGHAAVVYDGSFQVVNFGFPFEAITDAYRRIEVMTAILDFFGLDPDDPPPAPPADIVLESRDFGGTVTPPPAYSEDGSWSDSTAKSTAPGLSGTGSRFITYDLPNGGTDNATFIPNVVTPSKYEVFVTWGLGANCYDAKYTIKHYHGQSVLQIDQIPTGAPEPTNANEWISLGQYWFAAGQDVDFCSVNVSEETVSGKPSESWNQRGYADGLKLVFVEWWPNGDSNDDGDVDLDDFADFPGCLMSPGGGYAQPECEAFDFELDGDVDLSDFARFQEVFTG